MSTQSIYGENLKNEIETVRVEDRRFWIQSLGVIHHHVHDGQSFVASYDTGSIANGAVANVLFRTGAKQCHMNHTAAADGAFLLNVYENATYTAAGTTIPAFNRLRKSTNPSLAQVSSGPSISATGLALPAEMVPGGNHTGGATQGQDFDRFVLTENTTYLFRITNISGNPSRAVLVLAWYEPESQYV